MFCSSVSRSIIIAQDSDQISHRIHSSVCKYSFNWTNPSIISIFFCNLLFFFTECVKIVWLFHCKHVARKFSHRKIVASARKLIVCGSAAPLRILKSSCVACHRLCADPGPCGPVLGGGCNNQLGARQQLCPLGPHPSPMDFHLMRFCQGSSGKSNPAVFFQPAALFLAAWDWPRPSRELVGKGPGTDPVIASCYARTSSRSLLVRHQWQKRFCPVCFPEEKKHNAEMSPNGQSGQKIADVVWRHPLQGCKHCMYVWASGSLRKSLKKTLP